MACKCFKISVTIPVQIFSFAPMPGDGNLLLKQWKECWVHGSVVPTVLSIIPCLPAVCLFDIPFSGDTQVLLFLCFLWCPGLQKMLDECQDRRSCQFLVNSRLFGMDPCPGTGKYLLVWYKCRPSKYFSTKSVCSVETKAFPCSILTREAF